MKTSCACVLDMNVLNGIPNMAANNVDLPIELLRQGSEVLRLK